MTAMSYDAEFSELLHLFIQLVETQSGREVQAGNEWKNDAQVLSKKLFLHLVSMQYMAKRPTIEVLGMPGIAQVDHSSIQVVARAAFETYLVFFFIYGGSNIELSEFRHKIWHLSGLADRQRYSIRSEGSREVLELERLEMEKISYEISCSSYFDTYSEKQKRQILKGNWRTGTSWSDLGKEAGFHAGYFKNVYNYLCGYSHSSYASALQVGQAQSIEEQTMLARPTMSIGVVLMSHFVFSYPTVFPDAGAVLVANPVANGIAEKWRFGPEDMAEYYDA